MHVQMQIVQEGAALAPGWTEAMFHELLDQEASPASGAALHHAADIMSLHDTAKAQHCMAGMQQTISGGVMLPCIMPLSSGKARRCIIHMQQIICDWLLDFALLLTWYQQFLP